MKLRRLHLSKFTAFEDATFQFETGVNGLIGENACGKSHILKVLYIMNEAVRLTAPRRPEEISREPYPSLQDAIETLLRETFMPDDLGRLVRRARGRRSAVIEIDWTDGASLRVTLSSLGRVTARQTGDFSKFGRSVFLPTREVLSIFPGFIASWQQRESNFDRTYYDACVALEARPLRGPRDARRAKLLEPLEHALGGSVTFKNGRFYVQVSDGDMEAPLVAEGLRKLAMLAYLVINGALSENAFLLWDEPEASMNPKLAELVSRVIFEFSRWGVQVFLATHDYALASELSLEVERCDRDEAPIHASFFALGRGVDSPGVSVEAAKTMQGLATNPILDALANLHDRELALDDPQEDL